MNIPPVTLRSGRTIGEGYPCYVIAEIGSNHDGDLERAKMLIRAAKDAGADAAKFQSFSPETLININSNQDGMWVKDPAWSILERLAIPLDWHEQLQREAKNVGIDFLSTPFDLKRLQLLIDLNVPAIKLASGDLTYHELIRSAGKSSRPIFLSTGHATLGEVEDALSVLWESGTKDIVLMQCTSSYPSRFEDANIRAMTTLKHGFQVQVGISDHTPGSVVPLGAVSLGACVIEKHMTDDRSKSGPDHPFAMEVDEFKQMVKDVRNLEEALAGGTKSPRTSESSERVMARRAVYAKVSISKGAVLRRDMVNIVRHAFPEGIPANMWSRVDGRVAKRDIAVDSILTWDDI